MTINNEELEDDFEIEIEEGDEPADIVVEDDTPPEDRNRSPLPKEIVAELDADELEEYSDKVKTRLKQYKKAMHDERREKERAQREINEAVSLAQRALEENKQLKSTMSRGEAALIESYKNSADLEAAAARAAYKEAYDLGEADKLLAAQERLTSAVYKTEELKKYIPTLQTPTPDIQQQGNPVPQTRPDTKTLAWQERNSWWGVDQEMTATALGLHQKLEQQHGKTFTGTDEYWRTIDETMQRRFPEYFGDSEKKTSGNTKPTSKANSKPANVVAPASRSTSPKKIVLTQTQVSLARRLGVTPEAYAKEVLKLEK